MVSGGAMALCLAVLAALLVSAATRGAELRVGPRRALADEPNHPNAGSHRHPAWPGGPCDLCARNWLFVLSAYRTGSTTALSMFSSIPGFEIGGEHDGVLVRPVVIRDSRVSGLA